MKRNIIIIVLILVGIVATTLLGNIIIIGDKIGELTHRYVELGFYGAVLVTFAVLIIRPIIRIHYAPEFPKLNIDDETDLAKIYNFGRKLASNCSYIADSKERKQHKEKLIKLLISNSNNKDALKEIISNEICRRVDGDKEHDIKGINTRIKDWAVTVFMVTAVSQKSSIDTLSVIYFNYKMIEDIVLASGFRPTRRQLSKLYIRILGTAFVSFISSELTDNIDLSSAVADETMSDISSGSTGAAFIDKLRSLPIVNTVAGALCDGAINALLTLRIGYVTRSYIIEGSEAFTNYSSRRKIRRRAMIDALSAIPGVTYRGAKSIGSKTAKLIMEFLGIKSEEDSAEA